MGRLTTSCRDERLIEEFLGPRVDIGEPLLDLESLRSTEAATGWLRPDPAGDPVDL